MLERELQTALSLELRKLGWTVFKLRGDDTQRGLPDLLLWCERGVKLVELKIARTPTGDLSISPGQASVLRDLERTPSGAQVAWVSPLQRGVETEVHYYCGLFVTRAGQRERVVSSCETRAEVARWLARAISNAESWQSTLDKREGVPKCEGNES